MQLRDAHLCLGSPLPRLAPHFMALQPTGSATCKRGFCQFIYEPIKTVIEAAMNDNKDKLFGLLEKLEVLKKLKPEDKELMGKPLMKRVMQSW